MKLKTKFKIALLASLMLIIMCAFNVVYAETMTVDEILELIPEAISVDIEQAEYEDAEDVVIASVEESLTQAGVDITDYEVSYFIYKTYFSVCIRNEDGINCYKYITVKYSDYNEEDAQIILDYVAQFNNSDEYCRVCVLPLLYL